MPNRRETNSGRRHGATVTGTPPDVCASHGETWVSPAGPSDRQREMWLQDKARPRRPGGRAQRFHSGHEETQVHFKASHSFPYRGEYRSMHTLCISGRSVTGRAVGTAVGGFEPDKPDMARRHFNVLPKSVPGEDGCPGSSHLTSMGGPVWVAQNPAQKAPSFWWDREGLRPAVSSG